MLRNPDTLRRLGWMAVALTLAFGAPACGGGSTGGGGGAPHSLVLVGFEQAGVDNLPINGVLEFSFNEPLDPDSIMSGTVQVRQGPDFGSTADGDFDVVGSAVYFQPRLPGYCDYSDAGFQPGTTYRVSVVGYPEENCVRNAQGQPLDGTSTYEFSTLPDTADGLLQDQIPATAPAIVSSLPMNSAAATSIYPENRVEIDFSENLDPCTVSGDTVRCYVYERGDPDPNNAIQAPNGNPSGFNPAEDSTPTDPYTWGATNSTTVAPPQAVPATVELDQTDTQTRITLTPEFGAFPSNALVVVDLSFAIRDFGGYPLTPTSIAFTTENAGAQEGVYRLDWDGNTPIDEFETTADVNSARAPSRAQGFLLFAGDGNNGGTQLTPQFPKAAGDCSSRTNVGLPDDFDPSADVNLDTGASRNFNACANNTDGSYGVVWEFKTFRIRSGVTVRVTGVNPAIILVQGDALIEPGGTLLVKGDGNNGVPDSRGGNFKAYSYPQQPDWARPGVGVAGAGDGGRGYVNGEVDYGDDGWSGYGSDDYDQFTEQGGLGAGLGGVSSGTATYNTGTCSEGGGGGGHGAVGADGENWPVNYAGTIAMNATPQGDGGGIYPLSSSPERLYTPSCGSGGGAGGGQDYVYTLYSCGGGAGGAGGGFVDLTSGTAIKVYGTIDASGGRGGNGASANYAGSAGGGGGAGGGIRLLTPGDIDLTGGTLTAAGGLPGSGATAGVAGWGDPNAVAANGGLGGLGRIALEDGDSVITGYNTATVLPNLGGGLYVAPFDPSRFQGGGLTPYATTGYLFLGPLGINQWTVPEASDFSVGIPADASPGAGSTSMVLEIEGFPIRADGTPDENAGSGFYVVGYFLDTGGGIPSWVPNAAPGDVTLPPGSVGIGIGSLGDMPYVKVRLSFYLPSTIGAVDPGPWMDWWDIRFRY